MNYYNRGQQRGHNGGGQRYNNQRPRNNGSYQRQGGQPREDGDYPPNTGQLSPNARARNENDPHMSGVMNIEIEGRRYTFFISGWENKPGIFRLSFNPADGNGQGYRQNGSRQNSPQIRGNSRQNGQYNRGAYTQQMSDGYTQEQFEPRQNGAMSRARPIPNPVYHDGPPPHDNIPDGPDYVEYEEAPFDS